MRLTWFDANAWLLEAGERRILIDPWLVGDLVFNQMPWLIRGVRPQPVPIPASIDLILLSQGLEDHAHPETLKQLDRSIPVVASPKGAEVVQGMGYKSVTTLSHGETYSFQDMLQIRALPGAPIGPFLKENAYVLTAEGLKIYYEPHGYPAAEKVQGLVGVDVVITPMLDISILGVGSIIRGREGARELAKWLKPQIMLPTAEGGHVTYKGMLAPTLRKAGGADELRSHLQSLGLKTEVRPPRPQEPVELSSRGVMG